MILPAAAQGANGSPSKQGENKTELPLGISTEVHDLIFSSILKQDVIQEIRLLSGLNSDIKTEELEKNIVILKDSIEKGTVLKQKESTHEADMSLHYLPESEKLLIQSGAQLKLLSRDSHTHEFMSASSNVNMGPTSIPSSLTSDVRLSLSSQNLHYLITYIDWSLVNQETYSTINRFFEVCLSQRTHGTVEVPYALGLIVTWSLINVAVTQYELLETSFESLSEQETLHKFVPSALPSKVPPRDKPNRLFISLPFTFGTTSLVDAHKLLSILVSIED